MLPYSIHGIHGSYGFGVAPISEDVVVKTEQLVDYLDSPSQKLDFRSSSGKLKNNHNHLTFPHGNHSTISIPEYPSILIRSRGL